MEKSYTVFVVQRWHSRDEFWGDCAELADGMFGLPRVAYDTKADGQARLRELREQNPAGTFQLVQRVTTETVIG